MSSFSPDPRDLGPAAGRTPAGDALLARAARYARWDGTQSIPALDADEILDALADDVMAEGDLAEALRRLMERGWRGGGPTPPELPRPQAFPETPPRPRQGPPEHHPVRDPGPHPAP